MLKAVQAFLNPQRGGFRRFALLTCCLAPLSPAIAQDAPLPQRVEVIIADLSNPFFSHLARQIEARLNIVAPQAEVVVRSSGYDLNRQRQQLRDAVANGADFLIINAVNTSALTEVIAEARAKRIPVIAVDVEAEGADLVVTSDNIEAGRAACAFIAERLAGKGNVLILYGPPVSAVLHRNEGCQKALSSYPEITLLSEHGDSGGSRLGGLTYMSSLLPRLPHIDAVFSFNDPTSLGVMQAAREAGRDEFFIVSVDASPEGLRAMMEPGSLLAASVAQHPKVMADEAVAAGLALWRGEDLAQRSISVPVQLLTREMVVTGKDYWMAAP
ncbi:substrate-binding domain-containing protein [Xinfangfangia sp. CPCC 101601]|uniref:Substrate-binding domain-containing protein n=1 Tax=Pseudogemmobacter lacusdianii TaxID=3069608 RepID=A0ABU0VWZ5_9RHOB|nr:substrate-binding domain-containing protein [Xinfangfangia sp. CPCC 101601]MDQ2066143.1 substrate-binding domain-containing protein [Xinfangfangia sp. CPCC 101601]